MNEAKETEAEETEAGETEAEEQPSAGIVVLSIDVGIRNLGLALFHVPSGIESTRLLDLRSVNLLGASEKAKQVTAQEVTRRAERAFREYLGGSRRVDAVLVENQPYRSGTGGGVTMKLLAHGMIQYFRHRREWGHEPDAYATAELVHARNKLSVDYARLGVEALDADLPTGTYAQRKKSGVVLARHLLDALGPRVDAVAMEAFQRCKKKDDCADAFLQGLWWIVHRHS